MAETRVRPELVALDMAGTTVDEGDVVYDVLREVTTGAGATFDEDTFTGYKGNEKRSAIAGLVGTDDPGLLDRLHGQFVAELARRYTEQPPRPFPGVEEMFTRLREQGIKVALTTGFDRGTADLLLRTLGWDDGRLDAHVCGTEVAHGRPAPDMLLHLSRQLGVPTGRIWAVGDTPADLRAADVAGAVGIGVLTGSCTRVQLEALPHAHVLDSAAELVALLPGA